MRLGSKKRTSVIILIGIFAATFAFMGSAQAGSWSCFSHSEAERRFTKKMNNARSRQGLGKMNLDKQMSAVARVHSKQMARSAAIYHSTINELTYKVTRERLLSENVGRGGDVDGIHRAFMHSSGHRANILRSGWRHVGVGTVHAGGILYVTVIFESRRDPGTKLNPPSC